MLGVMVFRDATRETGSGPKSSTRVLSILALCYVLPYSPVPFIPSFLVALRPSQYSLLFLVIAYPSDFQLTVPTLGSKASRLTQQHHAAALSQGRDTLVSSCASESLCILFPLLILVTMNPRHSGVVSPWPHEDLQRMSQGRYVESGEEKGFKMGRSETSPTGNYNQVPPAPPSLLAYLRMFCGLLAYCSSATDFVGSEREFLPNYTQQVVLRLCRAGTGDPLPKGRGLVGAIVTIPIPSRSRKSVSSAIGRKGMKDQIDTSFPRLRCLSRGSRLRMHAILG